MISKVKLENLEECAQFYGSSSNKQGLDDFHFKVFRTDSSYTALWEIVKVVLILSHGQADVERGFSINKVVPQCNMSEKVLALPSELAGLQIIIYSEGQHYLCRLYLLQCLAYEVKQPLCSVLLQMSCEYDTRTNSSHDHYSSLER